MKVSGNLVQDLANVKTADGAQLNMPEKKDQINSISIVVPVFNEAESLEELFAEIDEATRNLGYKREIIFVDDGSTDGTSDVLRKLFGLSQDIKVICFRKNFGKAAALMAAFETAGGDVVITLDGDLQDDPREIMDFLNEIQKGFDLVSGWKQRRMDPISKRWPSKIFNTATSLFTGIKIHDFNCGYKAYRKEVVKELNIYGELHRFIPVLAAQKGFRISEIRVNHRPRKHGKTKYGAGRFIKGFLDFTTVLFLTNYLKRPSHFFGTAGLLFLLTGLAIGCYITYLRIATGSIQYRFPLLMLGILTLILGFQFFFTGLTSELIVRSHARFEPEYSIKFVLSHDDAKTRKSK